MQRSVPIQQKTSNVVAKFCRSAVLSPTPEAASSTEDTRRALEEIVGTVVSQLQGVGVDEVTVLDQGDGSGMASYAATYPKMVAAVLAALGESTGVDVPRILNGQMEVSR